MDDDTETGAPPLRHPPSHATLQVLRFQDANGYARDWDPLGPPPTSPVHLPALTTVIDVQPEHAAARVGRNWHTPNIRVLTFQNTYSGDDEFEGARQWIGDGTRLEKLEYDIRGCGSENDDFLHGVPEGQSLSGLRSLGRVRVYCDSTGSEWEPAEMQGFRDLLVRRGCVKTIREMQLDFGEQRCEEGYLEDTAETRELIERAAELVDAVMHPDALSQPLMPCLHDIGKIDYQLVTWGLAHPSPTVRKLVADYASGVRIVGFKDPTRNLPAQPVTPTAFPKATAFCLRSTRIAKAVEAAQQMPSLECVEAESPSAVRDFLEAFHAAAPDKTIGRVTLELPATSLTGRPSFHELGKNRNPLPPIEELCLYVEGFLTDHLSLGIHDSRLEWLHGSVLAFLQAASDVKARRDEGTNALLDGPVALLHAMPCNAMRCRALSAHTSPSTTTFWLAISPNGLRLPRPVQPLEHQVSAAVG